ncbi:PfkB family carbohydrate kinase [Vulcanisaeta souniana]|uniref:carbohydrate kinase family protein n=1 Tax=Vulcanisaeta souniana TaxID=164452 RepID=UPI000A7B6EA7|nr:PfkB family carbohydrate kinase [Vulcanisaeta souniana]
MWANIDDAINVLSKALGFADVVFLDEDEANLLLGVSAVDDVFRELRSRFGINRVVLKLGIKGSMAYWEGRVIKVNAFRVPVKDPIGAGDAYAGVFLASILRGSRRGERHEEGLCCSRHGRNG